MNKIYRFLLAMLVPLLALTSCDDKDEIVFDSQLPQFELRSDDGGHYAIWYFGRR